MHEFTRSKATEVCRFCGGETVLRHGDFGDRVHKRKLPQVGPVCTRTPELVSLAEYEAQCTTASQEQNQ